MYRILWKPLLDRSVALVLLILLAPIFLVTAVVIGLSLGRPVLFRQERPGFKERAFMLLKFRTMSGARDAQGNLLPDAQRLQGVGRFIRSASLDELPQLWNVLKGEMSLIGPRPLLMEYLPLYSEAQRRRHEVKPGITGWAQVNGRNAISWQEKFALDGYYVEHQSFGLDCRIVWLTLKKVWMRSNITQEGHATMEKFNGNN